SSLTPGDYETVLVFTDMADQTNQARIKVSLRVESAKPRITKIKISPTSINQQPGDKVKFDVNISGENNPDTSVTWKVNGASSPGTGIGSDGTLSIGSDESAGTLTVIVISNQDDNYKDTAAVNIARGSHAVNARTEPSDAGYVSGTGIYSDGDRATLTAVANKGYVFKDWITPGNKLVSNSATFTTDKISGNLEYIARFSRSGCEIKVRTSNSDAGSVKGEGVYDYGKDVTIEAKPKNGYTFDGWYEKDKLVSRDKKYKVKNVQKDHKFIAEFKSDKYVVNLAASPSEGGKVSGGGKFAKGESTTLKASPASGWHFKGYVLNNQVVSTSMELKVKDIDRDLSFTAYFEKDGAKTYTMTSGVANSGGVIQPSGKVAVTEGNSITYTMAPDNGYAVLAVAVDGKQIGAVSSYTFEKVTGDHTIAVAFAPKQNSVVNPKMDKIISTEEAAAIAVARLEDAPDDAEGGSSKIITPEEYQKMKNAAQSTSPEQSRSEESVETIVVPQEQNLVGMDDTEGLGEVVDTYNPDTANGVFQSLDITEETASKMIDAGDDSMLIMEAYEQGYLDIIVNNEYVVPGENGDIFTDDRTIKNMTELVRSVLTKEEKLEMMNGKEIMLSFTVTNAAGIGEEEKKAMSDISGVAIDNFLYMTLIKSIDGMVETVEELNSPMEITLNIPEEYRNADATFCIVRDHNGQVDVLTDLDDDPDTITIKTDRFSPYALGHLSDSKPKAALPTWLIVLIAVVVGVAVTFAILIIYGNARAKARAKRNRRRPVR
nr:InlB B-repeat-containing protein [Lachnospiraceae bacterium]